MTMEIRVNIVLQASKITKCIYNHCDSLYLMRKMRKHTGGRKMLHHAPTNFTINVIALQSILAEKDTLRAIITSREWTSSIYMKEDK